MGLIEIFSIIFIHFLADFCLQTDAQAKGKSKNNKDLIGHTVSYSSVWLILGVIYCIYFRLDPFIGLYFSMLTFISHTVTDYFTSRLNKKLWEQGRTHDFFVSVGFDQVLHYIQLFLTYQLLK